jgi:cystathionine beta-lyase
VLVDRAADLYDESLVTYGRAGLATQQALAEALAELEGASTVRLFPSGLAALTGAILALVSADDDILVTDGVYRPTRRFCQRMLARFGVQARYFPADAAADEVMALAGEKTRLIVLESPASLTFEMQDVGAIAAAARARGILTLMDNTWAAGRLFKPLAAGIDVSVQALTKYVGGHSDLFVGSAATADAEIGAALDRAIWDMGWSVGAEDAWLALRGLATLDLRLARHGESGLRLACWLEDRHDVRRVIHPALPSHPGHDLWRRDYSGAAGLFAIVLREAPQEAVHAFLDALEVFGLGFSWGGFESLAVHAGPQLAVRQHPPALEGPLVRLSVGLEEVEALQADLVRGLEAFADAS